MNFENYTRQLKHVCAFPFNISSKIDMIIIKEMKNFEKKILVKSVDTKQSLILVPFNNSISTSILQTKWNVFIACPIKSEREREREKLNYRETYWHGWIRKQMCW